MLGLFGVCSILTHYFAVYVVIGYALILLYTDRPYPFDPEKTLSHFRTGCIAWPLFYHPPLAQLIL